MGEKLRVQDVMSTALLSVGPDTSVAQAAAQMIENGIRALPVTNENGEVLGIITDRHVMDHFLPAITALEQGGKDTKAPPQPETALVRDVMRRTVLCLREDQPLDEVATLMINKDIERFMVAAEGKLTGFITRGDILRRLLPHRAEREEGRKPEPEQPRDPAGENLEIRWESQGSDET